jgi:Mrp family chromosome partitioning ATPase
MDPEGHRVNENRAPGAEVRTLPPAGPAPIRGFDLQRASVEIEDGDGSLPIVVKGAYVHRSPAKIAASLRYLLAQGELSNHFSLTSSIHGEGVTTVSRTLAALIAHDWRTSVCWVDLNWWKSAPPPRTEKDLFPNSIADVLIGKAKTEQLAVETSIRGLSMVVAGQFPISSRSIVAKSDGLDEIIDVLAKKFDYLVFDLPPVLASSDALTLGALGDGYLLVVRQRATSSAQVGAALRAMTTVPCLGTVLNAVRTKVPRFLRPAGDVWAVGGRG